MLRQFAILLSVSAIALLTTLAQAETLNVRLALSDNSPSNQQFSATFNKALGASKSDVSVIESHTGEGARIDLIVAVGMKAMELVIDKPGAPVLGVMIPRVAYEALLERRSSPHPSKAISTIYLDQPWDRQLNFIHAALPRRSMIGLLYSPDARIVLPRLPQGMSINAQSIRSDETFYKTLESVLDNSDALLATPDSEIYSSSKVRNILLTSYRHKVPLIGISQAYVNAGAICAIFSTPEQFAEQAAKMVLSFAKSRQLPAPQYSELFSIAVNQQVARSLEIELDSPEAIRERMDKTGEKR